MLLPLLAALTLSLGPEFSSSAAVPEPAHTAWAPAAASDGHDYVIGWLDSRGNRMAKVSADGAVVQPLGIPVPAFGYGSRIEWNGSEYLLFNGPGGRDIDITRLDRDLNVLDAQPKHMHLFADILGIVRNGSRFLLYLSGTGVLLGPEGDRMLTFALPYPVVAVGSNGNGFLVVTASNTGPIGSGVPKTRLEVTRVTSDGDLIDDVPRTIGEVDLPYYANPSFTIASDGDGYLLTWDEPNVGVDPRYVMRLDRDGTPVGSRMSLDPPSGGSFSNVHLIWSGSAYVFAAGVRYADGRQSSLRMTLDRDGNVSGSPVEGALNNEPFVAVASNGSSVLHVWSSRNVDASTLDVMTGQLLEPGGAPRGDPFPVTYSAPVQRHQEMAFDGHQFLAVWSEASGLYAARVTADGSAMSGRGVPIASNALAALPFALAFDGREFVLTWSEGDKLLAARLRGDGAADGEPVVVNATPAQPGSILACDGGGGCLVLWRSADKNQSVHSAVVRNGAIAMPDALFTKNADPLVEMAAVWDNHEYIVAFAAPHPRTNPLCYAGCGDDLAAVRVSSDGRRIDPVDRVFDVHVNGYQGEPLLMAWAGDQGLIFLDSIGVTIDRDLRIDVGVRVRRDAPPFDEHLVFDGRNYLLVAGNAVQLPDSATLDFVVEARVISTDARQSPDTSVIAPHLALYGGISALSLGNGRALVTYTRPDADGVPRAFSRFVTDFETLPPPPERTRPVHH